MFTITDASDTRLLAEAETLSAARLAARTMFEEGEELPILIHDDARVLEQLVRGPHGVMLKTSDLSRKYA